ncbi:SusC/RagA family TonB-linked outer membrane protein, partial [Parabacteroides sp. OttesenSCG-928-O15]|nr:SusC/RagA family TonB-linked outer membrane protein [Parabacteroides sp. OttesenSCG-928-O15]
NIGFNKSKIKKLYEGKPQISGNKILEEGIAIDTWYMEEWAGVDIHTGDPMWYIYNEDGSRTLTTDLSKATRVKQGSSNPDFTGGLMTTLSYKGLSLSGAFTFVSGNNIYHSARQFYDNDGAYITFNSMNLKDGWSRWEVVLRRKAIRCRIKY